MNVIGNVPVHVPVVAVTEDPTSGTLLSIPKLTTGYDVFDGAVTVPAAVTMPVALDAEESVDPAEFLAVTMTRSLEPTSAETTA